MKPIIYIIDDNIVSEFATKMVIDQASVLCEVFSFESGELGLANLLDALEKNRNVPNVILLDLKMPRMNGWDFLDRLGKITAKIDNLDIYTVSNFTSSIERKRANEHPLVKGYVERPLTLSEIERILSIKKES